MPDQEKRLAIVLNWTHNGNPREEIRFVDEMTASYNKLATAAKAAQAAVNGASGGYAGGGGAGGGSHGGMGGRGGSSGPHARPNGQPGQSGLLQELREAGDAAYKFGQGAMWANIPATQFLFTAGNLIQGLDWMTQGFSKVTTGMGAMARLFTVATVGAAALGTAMLETSHVFDKVVSQIREMRELTGQNGTTDLVGVLGLGGASQFTQALAQRAGAFNPGQAVGAMAFARQVAPGSVLPYGLGARNPYLALGVSPFAGVDATGAPVQANPADVALSAAQRLNMLSPGAQAMMLDRFGAQERDTITLLQRLLARGESPDQIKARGAGLFGVTDEDIQRADDWRLANVELGNALEQLGFEAGRYLIPAMTDLVRWTTALVHGFNQLIDPIAKLAGLFGLTPDSLLRTTPLGAVGTLVGGGGSGGNDANRRRGGGSPPGSGGGGAHPPPPPPPGGGGGFFGGPSTDSFGHFIASASSFVPGLGGIASIGQAVDLALRQANPMTKTFSDVLDQLAQKMKMLDLGHWGAIAKTAFDDAGGAMGAAADDAKAFLAQWALLAAAATNPLGFVITVAAPALPALVGEAVDWVIHWKPDPLPTVTLPDLSWVIDWATAPLPTPSLPELKWPLVWGIPALPTVALPALVWDIAWALAPLPTPVLPPISWPVVWGFPLLSTVTDAIAKLYPALSLAIASFALPLTSTVQGWLDGYYGLYLTVPSFALPLTSTVQGWLDGYYGLTLPVPLFDLPVAKTVQAWLDGIYGLALSIAFFDLPVAKTVQAWLDGIENLDLGIARFALPIADTVQGWLDNTYQVLKLQIVSFKLPEWHPVQDLVDKIGSFVLGVEFDPEMIKNALLAGVAGLAAIGIFAAFGSGVGEGAVAAGAAAALVLGVRLNMPDFGKIMKDAGYENQYLPLKASLKMPTDRSILSVLPGPIRDAIVTIIGSGGWMDQSPIVYAASGGIVNRPTLALLGEAGSEAVVPLHRTAGNAPLPAGGFGGTTINLTVQLSGNDFSDPIQMQRVAEKVGNTIMRNLRIQSPVGAIR